MSPADLGKWAAALPPGFRVSRLTEDAFVVSEDDMTATALSASVEDGRLSIPLMEFDKVLDIDPTGIESLGKDTWWIPGRFPDGPGSWLISARAIPETIAAAADAILKETP